MYVQPPPTRRPGGIRGGQLNTLARWGRLGDVWVPPPPPEADMDEFTVRRRSEVPYVGPIATPIPIASEISAEAVQDYSGGRDEIVTNGTRWVEPVTVAPIQRMPSPPDGRVGWRWEGTTWVYYEPAPEAAPPEPIGYEPPPSVEDETAARDLRDAQEAEYRRLVAERDAERARLEAQAREEAAARLALSIEERERLDAEARERRERADQEARDRRDLQIDGDWTGGGGGGTGGGQGGIPGQPYIAPRAPGGTDSLILPAAVVALVLAFGGGL